MFFGNSRIVDVHAALLDFAGGEVAVFDGLRHIVLIDRFAEVSDIVGGNFLVQLGFGRIFLDFELVRRGGKSDLRGLAVAGQHLRPLAPGRAVTFVDDDMREIVFGVVCGKESGVAIFIFDAEGLVGGNVNVRILALFAPSDWR